MPLLCAVDIAVYLASYFVRLHFMSRLAKSSEGDANKLYFVEEQMVATPVLTAILAVIAIIGGSDLAQALRDGIIGYWGQPFIWSIIIVGVFSQGTGVFGNLIFLDRRENTYCVPVNRSSSILAGVVASYLLLLFPGQRPPGTSQLIGAALIIAAIGFLTIPQLISRRREKLLAAKQAAA